MNNGEAEGVATQKMGAVLQLSHSLLFFSAATCKETLRDAMAYLHDLSSCGWQWAQQVSIRLRRLQLSDRRVAAPCSDASSLRRGGNDVLGRLLPSIYRAACCVVLFLSCL
ncbi:MAG: hypothetical protein KatS3mg111_0288 [Pirellulaceae bacterium]|nr:MAG: hypothetical protein KatS3mg111_0288 [Pirellulaceae bacterium]